MRHVGILAAVVLLVSGDDVARAAQGDCSQPVSTQSTPTASDCLFILRAAVGLESCVPECICAPSGSLPASATDALVCLRKAVGQPVTLACPCSGSGCTDNGNCADDDCVCSDCDDDLFCSDPANCQDDGVCQSFQEGCVCADCQAHPECLDGG